MKQGGQVFETVHLGNKLVILFSNGLSEVKPEREKNKIVSSHSRASNGKNCAVFHTSAKFGCADTCYDIDHI